MECNKLFLCSPEAAAKMEGCCSDACRKTPTKRPFDAGNIYAPFRKWYHYFTKKIGTQSQYEKDPGLVLDGNDSSLRSA